jgi:hypothetical protein
MPTPVRLQNSLFAGLGLFVSASGIPAMAAQGVDASSAAALAGVPVEVLVLNDRLRAQIAFQTISDPGLGMNAVQNIPGMNTYGGAAAGALGGALATAMMNDVAHSNAEDFARPGWDLLGAAQCQLRASESLATQLENAVRASAWGPGATVTRNVLGGQKGPEAPKGGAAPRYTLVATYSLDPQFGTLTTTLAASLFSNAVTDAPKRWQTHPARRDDLVVISPQVDLGPPTAEQIAFLDEHQRAQHAALLKRLAAKANKGNWEAREQYDAEKRWKPKPLRTPDQVTAWEPEELALLRARRWAADDCSVLRAAVATNESELGRMLSALWRGQLRHGDIVGTVDPAAGPPQPWGKRDPAKWAAMIATTNEPVATGTTRRIWKKADHMAISVRDAESTVTPLIYLHSWLPLSKSEMK